jgi:ferric enterobactin receptor
MVLSGRRLAILALGGAVLLMLASAPRLHAQATRKISGTVQDSATGEKIAFATAHIAGTRFAAQSNADGRFTLLGAPTDSFTLRVRFVGYTQRLIHIPKATTSAPLVVLLAPANTRIEGVLIRAEADRAVDLSAASSSLSMSTQQIQSMPAVGSADIFRALQLLPGVSSANDGSAGLYVRGGTPDQNLVLLDGMTV